MNGEFTIICAVARLVHPPVVASERTPSDLLAIERVLSRLALVRPSGNGYAAQCPDHDDENPSLTVCISKAGRPLVLRFADCQNAEIVEAIAWWIEAIDVLDAAGGER